MDKTFLSLFKRLAGCLVGLIFSIWLTAVGFDLLHGVYAFAALITGLLMIFIFVVIGAATVSDGRLTNSRGPR